MIYLWSFHIFHWYFSNNSLHRCKTCSRPYQRVRAILRFSFQCAEVRTVWKPTECPLCCLCAVNLAEHSGQAHGALGREGKHPATRISPPQQIHSKEGNRVQEVCKALDCVEVYRGALAPSSVNRLPLLRLTFRISCWTVRSDEGYPLGSFSAPKALSWPSLLTAGGAAARG